MSKHTTGPWRFYTAPQPNGCPIIGDSRGVMIAMLAHSINYTDQRNEAIANACLIAAAPDLFKAAKNCDRLLAIVEEQARCAKERQKLGRAEVDEDGMFGIAVKTDSAALIWRSLERERNELVAANRAAIAKATGEAA